MNPKLAFEEYAALKEEIRIREARLEELKTIILPLVPDDKEIQLESGYFYVQMKSKWTYTEATQLAEKELKKIKKKEEAHGLAKNTPMRVLYYRSGKIEEKGNNNDRRDE